MQNNIQTMNCTRLCWYGMMFGGTDYSNEWFILPNNGDAGHPHYLRCYDAVSATPLNGRRFQTTSQFATYALDPDLPQMNITDYKACIGTNNII